MNLLNWWLNHFPRYEFFIEYILFLIPMVVRLQREPHFWEKLLALLAGGVLLSSVWNAFLAAFSSLYVLRYLLLFGVGVLITLLCYGCSPVVSLFCCTAAYAAQHCFNRAFAILILLTGVGKGPLYNILYLLTFAAAMVPMLLVFTRRINTETAQYMGNLNVLMLSGVILLCTIVLNALWRANKVNSSSTMQTIGMTYDFIACLLALGNLQSIFKIDEVRHDAVVIQQMWEQERKQLAISQETVKMLNIKCHDMRHLLRLISAQQDAGTQQEIESIRELIDVYDSRVDTGNEVLNLLLAEKGLLCQKEKIRLNCVADGHRLEFMEKPDVYSLLGNALDNAIEAVRMVENPEMRIITLTVVDAFGMTSVCVENFYQGQPIQMQDGLPVTTNADQVHHGYGVKSMQYLVKKYHGEMSINTDNGIFSVKILLPFHP